MIIVEHTDTNNYLWITRQCNVHRHFHQFGFFNKNPTMTAIMIYQRTRIHKISPLGEPEIVKNRIFATSPSSILKIVRNKKILYLKSFNRLTG